MSSFVLWWGRGSHQGSSPKLSGAKAAAAAAKNLAEVAFGGFLPPLPGGIRPDNTTVSERRQTPAVRLQRWRDWDALLLFPDVPVLLLKVGHKRSGW